MGLIIIIAIGVFAGILLSRIKLKPGTPLVPNEWLIIGGIGAVVLLAAVMSGHW